MKYDVVLVGDVLCDPDNNNEVYLKVASPIVDIYYGVSSLPIVTEDIIKATFLTATGYTGSVNGRLYTFTGGYNYKYWCIPDEPNAGNRVIEQIKSGENNTTLIYDSWYKYYQSNPSPPQSISYGKLRINGTYYRVYRTIIKSSLNYEQYVYSFE